MEQEDKTPYVPMLCDVMGNGISRPMPRLGFYRPAAHAVAQALGAFWGGQGPSVVARAVKQFPRADAVQPAAVIHKALAAAKEDAAAWDKYAFEIDRARAREYHRHQGEIVNLRARLAAAEQQVFDLRKTTQIHVPAAPRVAPPEKPTRTDFAVVTLTPSFGAQTHETADLPDGSRLTVHLSAHRSPYDHEGRPARGAAVNVIVGFEPSEPRVIEDTRKTPGACAGSSAASALEMLSVDQALTRADAQREQVRRAEARDNALEISLRAIERKKPRVVCLCGSTRFKDVFEAENERLTLLGNIVLSVGSFGHHRKEPLTAQEKTALDALHLRKIDMADEVRVLNVGDYIGASTANEIRYAFQRGKMVTFYEGTTFSHGPRDVDPVEP